ncbi:MAG: CarD family transcriptional regulator, partial [Pseudomonadota bacterium]
MIDRILTLPSVPADAGQVVLSGVADGLEGLLLAKLLGDIGKPLIFVARDANRMADIEQVFRFAAPKAKRISLPAWDCLPYDRVSPSTSVSAQRLNALARIGRLSRQEEPAPTLILTTANAILQRTAPPVQIAKQIVNAKAGSVTPMDRLIDAATVNGFERVPTVREVGEFAVRGGILDIFAPGFDDPVRLDFFGDQLETVRSFDASTQRTTKQRDGFSLLPMSEVTLTQATISRFRKNYIEQFGAPDRDDALYQAIAAGNRFAGMEHWLPLFLEQTSSLFDALPDTPVIMDALAPDAIVERIDQIAEYFQARTDQRAGKAAKEASGPYHPLAPDALYLDQGALDAALSGRTTIRLTPFEQPESEGRPIVSVASRPARNFSNERADKNANVFEEAARHLSDLRNDGKRVVLSGWSEGSLQRLIQILGEHELGGVDTVGTLDALAQLPTNRIGCVVLNVEHGFTVGNTSVVAEQDILGDRMVRRRKKKRASNFIAEVASIAPGDIVVHVEHGIGRFERLRTIEAAGAPHDCLEIHYA